MVTTRVAFAFALLTLLTACSSIPDQSPMPPPVPTTAVRYWKVPEAGVQAGSIWVFAAEAPTRLASRPDFASTTDEPAVSVSYAEFGQISGEFKTLVPPLLSTEISATVATLSSWKASNVIVSRLRPESLDVWQSVEADAVFREQYKRAIVTANGAGNAAPSSEPTMITATWSATSIEYIYRNVRAGSFDSSIVTKLSNLGFTARIEAGDTLVVTYSLSTPAVFAVQSATVSQLRPLWEVREATVATPPSNDSGNYFPEFGGWVTHVGGGATRFNTRADCNLDVDGGDVPTYQLQIRRSQRGDSAATISCRFEAREDPRSGDTVAGYDWRAVATLPLPPGAILLDWERSKRAEALESHQTGRGWTTWSPPAGHIVFHAGFERDGRGDDCPRLKYAVGLRARFRYAIRPGT